MTNLANALRIEGRAQWEALPTWKRFASQWFGKKWYVGDERRAGWSGFLPFYVFWCIRCRSASKNYPSGFPGHQILVCQNPNCNTRYAFTSWKANVVTTGHVTRLFLRTAFTHPQRKRLG